MSGVEYLSDKLKRKVKSEILRAGHGFFFLDFDGTLAPIMPKPSMSHLRESTRRILQKLTKNRDFSVAIVTGRQLAEIESLVGIPDLIYAGNHGLELKGPEFKYTHAIGREFQRVRGEVIAALGPLTQRFAGTFIEDKEIGLAFHYRLLEEARVADMRAEVAKVLTPWLNDKQINVLEVKKALEVRPNLNWNKGSAVRWILLHEDPDSLPVYIGDDRTDENAFRALQDRGITIRVGFERKSLARYYVEDIYETEQLLTFLSVTKGSAH